MNCFQNFVKKKKISTILTAHNLEDQVETFFLRLSRGSGLTGLSAMKTVGKISNGISLCRPFLNVKKKTLVEISKISFGKFFKDPSNKNEKYLRTKIRNLKKPLKQSGISYDQVIKSINNLDHVEGRRQIFITRDKGEFIIDYAHTVQAYKNIFTEFDMNKKVCTLFGCGGDRDISKRKNTSRIVDHFSSKIIITEDNSRTEQFKKILKDILKGIKNLDKVKIIKSRKKAIRYMLRISSNDQLNFIMGKGNENYILENNKKIKHNDVDYLKCILRNYEYKTVKDC